MAEKYNWIRLLAYVTGLVNQELLLRNEYLVAENRILKAQIKGRLRLSDGERSTLAEIAKRLGHKALAEIACVAKPATILAWYRRLVAQKFDGSKARKPRGRPRVEQAVEQLVVKMARENSGWGYDRIVGAMANLGHLISDQTVGNILRRHGMPPVPERKRNTTWKDFIATHMSVLAGTDFFTAEVITWRGFNPAIQEYHYLPDRGVPLGPWESAICHVDAWLVGEEDGKSYLEQSLASNTNQFTKFDLHHRRTRVERLHCAGPSAVAHHHRFRRNHLSLPHQPPLLPVLAHRRESRPPDPAYADRTEAA